MRISIEALNTRMNTAIGAVFSDPNIFDVFTVDFLLACIDNGGDVDPGMWRPSSPEPGLGLAYEKDQRIWYDLTGFSKWCGKSESILSRIPLYRTSFSRAYFSTLEHSQSRA